MINLYGFSLLRNGVKYDYSFKESLLSLAPIVQKIYLALDSGSDTTESEIQKLPFVKIIPSLWDMTLKKGMVLSVETNIALQALRSVHGNDQNAWGIYLQADEVLHSDDYELLKNDIAKAQDMGCDAISFRYLHFWQTHHHLAVAKNWYPEEIRAIKLDSKIESYGDAQSFKNQTKIFKTEARIFHYGHVRDQSAYKNKMSDMSKLYDNDAKKSKYYSEKDRDKDDTDCVSFFGTHPPVMKDRILRMNDIWELEEKKVVYIVGKPEKYSKKIIAAIKAEKIIWCGSSNEVPILDKKNMIITEPSIIDYLFKRSKTPMKMKSKLAVDWSLDFRFVLQVSEKQVGFKAF